MSPEDEARAAASMKRREAILVALRSFDWIDVGNHPGDDEQYDEIADAIEAAIADSESLPLTVLSTICASCGGSTTL